MKDSFLIQSKDNNLMQKSSSGGMFAELSKYVLSQGGVVFGCEMVRVEEGFDVRHVYIEDEKDLYRLQGSKYVQSRLGNTIKQSKDFLENGRMVLFSGTPCQIAGLKAFLKKDYENLLAVDLSCTGTPSLKIFNDYINFLEHKYKKKIIKFEFRNKQKMGWSCGNALITFENGKQKILYNNISSYLNLFITKKIQSKSCQTCKYNGLERISDITLADAWGFEQEYPNLLKTKFNKNKGISLALINTNKGTRFFEHINKKLIFEEINITKLQKYNGPLNINRNLFDENYLTSYKNENYTALDTLFKKQLNKKYYYYVIKNYTPKFIKNIIKLFLNKKEKQIDCLLMTMYNNVNYGSLLTAYALQKTISSLGYKNKVIHYGNSYGYGKLFIKKYLKLTKRIVNANDFFNLNKISNIFILGSDNLINLDTCSLAFVSQSLLNFTADNQKRLMISGSIGSWNGLTKTKQEYNYIKYLLKRFDYLSTREEYGKEVFRNVFDVDADWINDPVFYLKKEDYKELTKDVKQNYSDKIIQYVLYPTDKTKSIVEYYQDKLNTEVVKFDGNENVKYFSETKNNSVENWLSAIINSKLIITDSFHCIAFCLIFNKQFVCIKNVHSINRFTSLFKRLGISIPLIKNVDELEKLNFSYDKEQVNRELNSIREFAISTISQELSKTKKEVYKDKKMQEYNRQYIKNSTPWYKKSKLFYFGIIVPFVIPVKRLISDLRNKR